MKRKRSSTPPTRRSVQASHKGCTLLQLPRELRVQILQYLLYSPEPLGKKCDDNHGHISERRLQNTFTFYPAILRVCRQVYTDGYEILYCQNIASANILLCYDDECSSVDLLDGISPYRLGGTISHRFLKWDISVKLHIEIPKGVPDKIFDFVSDILYVIPNLKHLKVRLEFYSEDHDPESHITFADPLDFDDIAEQIFRPFSTIRVRRAEFVDKQGNPIRTTLSLSGLMMSDTPPPMKLHSLFDDLERFLDDSLTAQSRKVFEARLNPLELACRQYDVDAFRSTLRSLLPYLSQFRGLVPPQHLIEFAQDSASVETGMGKISDCPKDIFVPP